MHIGHGARVKHTGGEPLPDDYTRGCGTLLVDELDAAQCRINRGFPMLWQARRTDTSVVLADALLTQG